LGVENLFWVNR